MVLSDDDTAVPAENSIQFYLALRKFGIPSEIHIFKRGGHGFGFGKREMPVSRWTKLCELWFLEQNLITPNVIESSAIRQNLTMKFIVIINISTIDL